MLKKGLWELIRLKPCNRADREKRRSEGITAGALKIAKDTKARDDAIRRRVAETGLNTQ